MRDFLNRQEEQGGLKKIHTKQTQYFPLSKRQKAKDNKAKQ